jgi:hypothetical protein
LSLRFCFFLTGAVVSALLGGCGLFFEGEPGQGGAGQGGAGIAVSATSAGGGPTTDVTATSTTSGTGGGANEWLLSYTFASLQDLSTDRNGRIYFAGVGRAEMPGGLPFPANTPSGERLYVASIESDGSSLVVRDLGNSLNSELRLSHGDGPRVHVAWTHGDRFCAKAVDDLALSTPGDCFGAEFRCTETLAAGALDEPGIAETAAGALVASFHVKLGTQINCSSPNHNFAVASGDAVIVRGGANGVQVKAGQLVDHVRLSTAGELVHVTGHCALDGSLPGGATCTDPGFELFGAQYDPASALFSGAAPLPMPEDLHPEETTTAFPSPGPAAYTAFQPGPMRRVVRWSQAAPTWLEGAFDGSDTQTGADATAVRSAEIVDDRFVLTGVTDLPLSDADIACEDSSLDCGPLAFWAEVDGTNHAIKRAQGYQVHKNANCAEGSARASGGFIQGGSLYFGGTYACGKISIGGVEGVDAADKDAVFLARVEAP